MLVRTLSSRLFYICKSVCGHSIPSVTTLSEVPSSDPFWAAEQNPSLVSVAGDKHSQHSSRIWPKLVPRRIAVKNWKEQVEENSVFVFLLHIFPQVCMWQVLNRLQIFDKHLHSSSFCLPITAVFKGVKPNKQHDAVENFVRMNLQKKNP